MGYARISTSKKKQKYSLIFQKLAIEKYCKENNIELVDCIKDRKSGRNLNREGLQKLFRRKKEFEVLISLRVSRLTRNVLHGLQITREILSDKVFVFIEEPMDIKTKQGSFLFTILIAQAELERGNIGDNVKAGLKIARKNGKRLGAKPKYLEFRKRVVKLRKKNMPWKEICQRLEIDYRTAKKSFDNI